MKTTYISIGSPQIKMERRNIFDELCGVFEEEASRRGLRGVLGIAAFDSVYSTLLPIQKELLKGLCGDKFDGLMGNGSFICIAYAYPDAVIHGIAVEKGGSFDKERWNEYARWYRPLNDALNGTAERLARETDDVALPATVAWGTDVSHVEDYYRLAVSHRVAAEQAGIGWRGKNELIVNPRYGCAIRLASTATALPLERTTESYEGCGDCHSCLDACQFLRRKDSLENYREQCRRYITALELEAEVCGKCIKACADSPMLRLVRERGAKPPPNPVYYTST